MGYKLNKELINPYEVQIAKLKRQIEAFKKYDKERTEYYAEIVKNYAANEEYIKELESNDNSKLRKKNEELNILNQRYLTRLQNKGLKLWSDEEYEKYKLMTKDDKFKEIEYLHKIIIKKDLLIKHLIKELNEKKEIE